MEEVRKRTHQNMEKVAKVKLNLASGDYYIDGYINIDNKSQYNGDFKVDKVADVFSLEWEDNSVDEILLNHFMMYVSLTEAPKLLKHWFGWLKKDGILVIETGNIKNVAKIIAESSNPEIINGSDGLKQFYGWETTAGHKWGWCPDTLIPLLLEAGFSSVDIGTGTFHHNPERDFLAVATK